MKLARELFAIACGLSAGSNNDVPRGRAGFGVGMQVFCKVLTGGDAGALQGLERLFSGYGYFRDKGSIRDKGAIRDKGFAKADIELREYVSIR